MAAFDPYHRWLGIPPEEQPPHHYRLLGLPLFESDPEVISQAADQRMGHLRQVQTGPHGAESQRLLNEVAAARRCLLHAQERAVYDARLRAALAPPAPASPPLPPVGPPPAPAMGPLLTLGLPLQPPRLPIGKALPPSQPAPPGIPILSQQIVPGPAHSLPAEASDLLAEIVSEDQAAGREERAGRHPKQRRGRRQTAGSWRGYSLVMLVLGVTTLSAVLWYRASGRHPPSVANRHTADSKASGPASTEETTGDDTAVKTGPATKLPTATDKHGRHTSNGPQHAAAPSTAKGAAKPPESVGMPAAKPLSPSAPPPSPDKPGPEPNPSKADGFRPLFNGVDLSGWRTHPAQPGTWRVENGILTASGADTTHLFSDREDFRNVYVRARLRVSRDSNGGIFVRSTFGPKPPAPLPQGYEARVFGNKVNSGTLRCYAPNQIVFPTPKPIQQPVGWLTLEFRVVEADLMSLIDGQEACATTDPQRLFDHGLIAVQFRGPPNGSPASKIEFRSIEIKELPMEQQAQN